MRHAAVVAVAAAATAASVPLCIKLAGRFGIIDRPGGRKVHPKPTPLFGGFAVAIGFLSALAVGHRAFDLPFDAEAIGLVLGAVVIVFTGLVDDVKGLGAVPKMLAQAAAGAIALVGMFGVSWFVAQPLTALTYTLWFVGLVNALNFLDTMDGLCVGVALAAAASFAVVGQLDGAARVVVVSLSLAGAALGFAPYNYYRARIFLGDVGSLLFGYALAATAIVFVRAGTGEPTRGLVPLLVLAYPIFDVSFVTLSRIKEGRPVHVGSTDHTSHRVAELGLGRTRAVVRIHALCAAVGAAGVVAYVGSSSPVTTLFAAVVAMILAAFGVNLNYSFTRLFERVVLVLGDVAVAAAAVVLVAWLKFNSGLLAEPLPVPIGTYAVPAIWMSFAWVVLQAILGGYDLTWDGRLRESIAAEVRIVALGTVILGLLTFEPGRAFVAWLQMSALIALVMMIGFSALRVMVFMFERRYYMLKGGHRRAVVVGGPVGVAAFRRVIREEPMKRYCVVGVVPWPPDAEVEGPAFADPSYPGLLLSRIRSRRVDELLLAPDDDVDGFVHLLRGDLKRYEMSVKVLPERVALLRGITVRRTWHSPLYRLFPDPMRTWEWGVKRALDTLLAPVLFAAFAPIAFLLLVVAQVSGHGSEITRTAVPGRGRIGLVLPVQRFVRRYGGGSSGAWSRLSLTRWIRLRDVWRGRLSVVGPPPIPEQLAFELVAASPDRARWFNYRPGLLGPRYDPLDSPDEDAAVFRFIEEQGMLRTVASTLRLPFVMFGVPRELRACVS